MSDDDKMYLNNPLPRQKAFLIGVCLDSDDYNLTELGVGRYFVTITDVNSCVSRDTIDITMPDVGDPGYMWYILGTVEAALAHGETFPSRSEEYGIGFREDLEFGHNVSGVEYAKVTKMRSEFSGKLHQMLDNVDCMVCPSMSNSARNKSENPYNMSGEEWKRLNRKDVFSKPFNFSGVPTLSVPVI